ncbi:hypothetical protein KDA_68340 [Dictyobacter alpinus]|uniref:Uncharacterized protein n=1 Tax=Dictyobacter alpinus TaxID=2014873 RepID=A0A402BJ35_9CHLR|nr:hypothetical protein [Dictyobacter alpinus]GCE31350.1 hypothetical protein KDA_68340 [Dictyobacter alpinus]
MELKEFEESVQTATVVGAAYGIHRTTLTQAAKAGTLGNGVYRSGDAWLIKTDHPDFLEWLRGHEYQPRVKGYRRKMASQEDVASNEPVAVQLSMEEPAVMIPPEPIMAREVQEMNALIEEQPEAEEQETPIYPARQRVRRLIVYVDVQRGEGVTEAGEHFTFAEQALLSVVLAQIPFLREAGQVRVWLCGELPTDASGSYEGWVLERALRQWYTTGKRGHYLSDERPEETVARYSRRSTDQEIEIRHVYSWFGTEGTAGEAREAIQLLTRYLQLVFGDDASAYATPALTFQSLWTRLNRIQKKEFAPLPLPLREQIRSTSGQGRIELCTLSGLKTLPSLYYYDGIFMYSALAWGLPTEIAYHDTRNEYAGKVAARYRIRYTVPTSWSHLGLFMTPREQVTGNPRDRHTWAFPGAEYVGKTYETWVDGSELDVLSSAYLTIDQGFAAWSVEILERIVFKPEKESAQKKPLDGIIEKLATLREKVERDALEAQERTHVFQLVRGGIRNIVLHGIGTFNRSTRNVTYIMGMDEPAPADYTSRREIDEDTVWYSVPTATEGYSQQFDHPEWAAQVWARCRARMIKAALTLPRESIIAIRTDAIAMTQEQPVWNANTKRGTLRLKWAIQQSVNAPHTYEALDLLQRQQATNA